MATPSLAPQQHTPANLPYNRQDILIAQDVVDDILEYSHKWERETAQTARFDRVNPTCSPADAVARILEAHDDLEEIVQAIVLREFQRRGHIELCLAAYDWFLGNNETATVPQFYDAALYACASKFLKLEKALSVLEDCTAIGVQPSVLSYNMLIASCSHSGRWEEGFQIFERALNEGVQPNSFTIELLIGACNFKRKGVWERAMYAVSKLQELSQGDLPESLTSLLLDLSAAAMHNSTRWQDAMAVFVGLQKLGLECNTSAFNNLLRACGRDRAWETAVKVFEHMIRVGVTATTETYNLLMIACQRSSQPDKVLEIFEWMVEGRGAEAPIEATVESYNIILAACHERGMLEKALEVVAWMQGSSAELDMASYDELLGTIEVAEMWDQKGRSDQKSSPGMARRGLTKSFMPRPSPYDGMRVLYLEEKNERYEDEILAQEKLGIETWAPSTMRPAASKLTASDDYSGMASFNQGLVNSNDWSASKTTGLLPRIGR